MDVLDVPYLITSKTIPTSSFYTLYSQRYSDFKTFGDHGGHLEFSQEKLDEKNGNNIY